MRQIYLSTVTALFSVLLSFQTLSFANENVPKSDAIELQLTEAKEAYMAGCKFLEARNNLCSCVWSRLETRYKAAELIALHQNSQYPEGYKPFVKNVIHHCVRGY